MGKDDAVGFDVIIPGCQLYPPLSYKLIVMVYMRASGVLVLLLNAREQSGKLIVRVDFIILGH
eukprot:8221899-Ditylum_brightwellii.AAC.1